MKENGCGHIWTVDNGDLWIPFNSNYPKEVLANIEHSIESVLNNISQFLPMMASSSSIFIDSAGTYLATYLTLEQTVHQLNSGKVPAIFLAGTNSKYKDEIIQLVATRRFTLIPLVEKKESNQNGLVWLKIEPVNIVPYPMTAMRGLKDEGLVPGKSVQELFENGRMIGSKN
jgi:hypothetical protein